MKVIIRQEHYDVYEERKVLASYQGPAPHVLMFNGCHWQRMIVTERSAEKVIRLIRRALRKGQKSINLNEIGGLNVSIPRFKIKSEE